MSDESVKADSGILSFDEILKRTKDDVREMFVPQLGGSVQFKMFSKFEIDKIRSMAKDESGEVDSKQLEKLLFLHGMLSPRITEEQHDEMLKAPAGGVVYYSILNAIIEENGLGAMSQRQIRRTFRPA